MAKNSKRYAVSSEQKNVDGSYSWSIWSYARDEQEYKEYIRKIEECGFRARVRDRETNEIIYITK